MVNIFYAEQLYNQILAACQEYLPLDDEDINHCTTRTINIANALFNNLLRISRNQTSLITSKSGNPISLLLNFYLLLILWEIVTSPYSHIHKDNLVKSLVTNITISHKFFRKSYLKSDGTAALTWAE